MDALDSLTDAVSLLVAVLPRLVALVCVLASLLLLLTRLSANALDSHFRWVMAVNDLHARRLILTSLVMAATPPDHSLHHSARSARAVASLAAADWTNAGFTLRLAAADAQLLMELDAVPASDAAGWPARRSEWQSAIARVDQAASAFNDALAFLPSPWARINGLEPAHAWSV